MGRAIDREKFVDADYSAFQARLDEQLDTLSDLLSLPGFGVGAMTIGSELEVHVVDPMARPLPINRQIVDAAGDDRINIELVRFNVELNTRPVLLAGRSLQALGLELRDLRALAERAARAHGGQTVTIGMLPTAELAHLGEDMITDSSRFRALANSAARLRGEPCRVTIGAPHGKGVDLVTDGISCAGPTTSFQVHLRVAPRDFTAVYNAVQMATAPVLAACGNAPMYLSNELWDETRIALLPQAFEYRPANERTGQPRVPFGMGWCKGGILELLEEAVREHPALLPVLSETRAHAERSGGAPALPELRLHNGTVWRWNRPVYDDAAGGHVRIEMRALPAGPTVVDMIANAALMIGLSLGLASEMSTSTLLLPFAEAEKNFHEAARRGLDAELAWPAPERSGVRREDARSLVLRLLPIAHAALLEAGVANADAEPLLALIEARIRSRRTGAAWQRHLHGARATQLGASEASRAMLMDYIPLAREGLPVHQWDAR